jgi:PAS domain S-box-containing protein
MVDHGLRHRVRLAAVVSLSVALAALAVALAAAADGRAASRELSGRLVPAAAEAGAMSVEYTLQRTAMRDYAVDHLASAPKSYEAAVDRVRETERRLGGVIADDPDLRRRLASAQAAQQGWTTDVARVVLAAGLSGDWAAAAQAQRSDVARQRGLEVQTAVADLQSRITAEQASITGRLRRSQDLQVASLLGTVVLVIGLAGGGVAAVRRWLLLPFAALRRAADAVAAGEPDAEVPVVGPVELADLGRSVDTMRAKLVAAERRYRGLLDASPDATIQVTPDGSMVRANRQAERLFGYPAGELVGRPVELLMPEAVRAGHPALRARYLADPQFREMGYSLQVRAVHRGGREIPVEVTLSAIDTEEGPLVSAAVRNITDRLAAQAERERLIAEAEQARVDQRLAHTQRLESLGQLVGGVAHDFNNLLNVILGYTAFIAEQVTASAAGDPRWEATRADVEQVHAAAQRAARLTHQLLAFGRRETSKPEVVNLNTVVAGVEQLLLRTLGEHIDLVTMLDPDLRPVLADPGHLEQVLVNLAVNARDAMPTGGKLSIDTDNIDVDDAYATAYPGLTRGRYARLRVSDTGTGMDRATLARVFEPFFTTKPKGQGTGLGLATVYGLITQAGGHPQLYSEPGLGTTFTALLPVTDEGAGTVAAPPQATPAPGHGEAILLVEDEQSLRDLVARILTRHGYHLYVATTARHALDLAGDLDQPLHLLLTDVVMPGMLGREVAARVRALRPDLAVLYMSGYAYDVLDTQGTLDHSAELLEKPFTEDALLHRIHTVLERRPSFRTQP